MQRELWALRSQTLDSWPKTHYTPPTHSDTTPDGSSEPQYPNKQYKTQKRHPRRPKNNKLKILVTSSGPPGGCHRRHRPPLARPLARAAEAAATATAATVLGATGASTAEAAAHTGGVGDGGGGGERGGVTGGARAKMCRTHESPRGYILYFQHRIG